MKEQETRRHGGRLPADARNASESGAPSNAPGNTLRFSPLFNDAFLRIFGSSDSEPVTRPLLNSLLREAGLEEILAVDGIVADAALPGGVECKSPRLDVVVLCDDGRLVNLEAQSRRVDVGAKSLFYASKLLVENAPKGGSDSYGDIPKVVVVVLLEGDVLFPDDEQYLSVCRMAWEVGRRSVGGPDGIVVIAAELDKVAKRYNGGSFADVLQDEALAWLYLLAEGYKHPEEADQIMDQFPTMEEFGRRYGLAVGDPDLKRAYDRYWESTLEHNSIMKEARRQGMEQGLEQGLEQGMKRGRDALAAQLRELGVDEAILAEGLALSEQHM